MASRVRRPEITVLPLSAGDTVTVKKHLNAGETRQIFARMYRPGTGSEIDPTKVGLSKILGYLLDWTFLDAADKPIVIADQPEDVVAAAIDALNPEDYTELLRAIELHDDAMTALRAAEKNARGGEKSSSAISPSPSAVAGDTNGSPSSIPTFTPSSLTS